MDEDTGVVKSGVVKPELASLDSVNSELATPVVARGKAIWRSDAEIEEMTSVAALRELAEEAAAEFAAFAPPAFRNLLGKIEKS